jgi:hypothetical protein
MTENRCRAVLRMRLPMPLLEITRHREHTMVCIQTGSSDDFMTIDVPYANMQIISKDRGPLTFLL